MSPMSIEAGEGTASEEQADYPSATGATVQPVTPEPEIPPAPPPLARCRNIIGKFHRAIKRSGLVGEQRVATLLFLAMISRILMKPVSVVVKGPSSAGKSNVVEKVLAFFPESAYYCLTGMSDRALAYSREPLSHRMLVIYEAAGISGEMATYMLRSLLSEGRIDYETVKKTAEGMKTERIRRDGPTGLISTTTALSLHPENETRFFSVPITDTPEQTGAILEAMAEERHETVDLAPWHELQRWLETAEHRVTIPFAKDIARLAHTSAPRIRRDFPRILNLIKVHAILHQMRRNRDDDGRIIAEMTDYEAVHKIVADLAAEAVEMAVPGTVRETVDAVRAVLKRKGTRNPRLTGIAATKKEIATELGLDKSSGGRRVKAAIALGYLRDLAEEAGQRGGEAKIVLGDDLPTDGEVLPSPARLRAGCAVAEVAEG